MWTRRIRVDRTEDEDDSDALYADYIAAILAHGRNLVDLDNVGVVSTNSMLSALSLAAFDSLRDLSIILGPQDPAVVLAYIGCFAQLQSLSLRAGEEPPDWSGFGARDVEPWNLACLRTLSLQLYNLNSAWDGKLLLVFLCCCQMPQLEELFLQGLVWPIESQHDVLALLVRRHTGLRLVHLAGDPSAIRSLVPYAACSVLRLHALPIAWQETLVTLASVSFRVRSVELLGSLDMSCDQPGAQMQTFLASVDSSRPQSQLSSIRISVNVGRLYERFHWHDKSLTVLSYANELLPYAIVLHSRGISLLDSDGLALTPGELKGEASSSSQVSSFG
jgi:hypothetical protein